MNIQEALAHAESLLPGVPAPDDERDPRWQAIIEIGRFIESDPDAVWQFIARWGSNSSPDLRAAIATCLLEHLLDHDFEVYFPLAEAACSDPLFADMVTTCCVRRPDHQVRLRAIQDHVSKPAAGD